MSPVTQSTKVGLGQTGRADADLKVSSVTEAITVTASAPTVLETTQVTSNMTHAEVDALPIRRNQLEITQLAPGVNTNTPSLAQFQISGSPGYDNLVLVNGVVVSENLRSQARPLYVEDAVQETTVMTGAISAEYGRFTGGVVNSITKSGGNEFSGSLRDSLTNDAWTSENLSILFFALAAGSILYVVIELLNVCRTFSSKSLTAWGIVLGLTLGFATDFILVAAGV